MIDFKQEKNSENCGVILSHPATQEEIDEMKQQIGVFNPNKNYNKLYDGHGTGASPPTEEQWNEMVGSLLIDEIIPPISLPTTVDLSESVYFPKVGDQEQQGSSEVPRQEASELGAISGDHQEPLPVVFGIRPLSVLHGG